MLGEGGWAEGGRRPLRGRWMVVLGAFLIQLLIPTVFSAYGVLLEVLIRDNGSDELIWRGLFPPILHITARTLMDPVFSSTFSGQSTKTKISAMFGVLMLVGSIALNILTDVVCLQIFTFGIIGGISTSLVVTQADAVLYCHFPSHRGLTQVVNHLGLALGNFGIPLLANGLILTYGIRGSIWLYCGAVLHGLIGATLLSPPRDNTSVIHYSSRPRSHTMDDVELREFSSNEHGCSGRSPLLTRDRCWKNPALASDSRYNIPQTNSISVLMRHRTTNGVDILPEIPEESEESDEAMVSEHFRTTHSTGSTSSDGSSDVFRERESSESVLTIHVNNNLTMEDSREHEERLSTTSLQKWRNSSLGSETNDTVNEALVEEDYEKISYCPDASDMHTVTSSTSDVLRSRRDCDCDCHCTLLRRVRRFLLCSCCSNACIYDVFIAIINVPNNIHFFVIEPFIEAIQVPYFFPAALFHTVSFLCPVLFVTFIPSLVKMHLNTNSPQEGAFSISIAAFSSLCFLLFSPYILQSQVTTKRVVYFIGSIFLATGLNMSTTQSHSLFALGCTFFGLGHGATLGTTTYVLEEALGMRNFIKVQGPLGFMSGCFILFSSVLLGFVLGEENGLSKCFVALSAFQASTNIVLVLSFLKTCLKSRWLHLQNINSTEWQPSGSFLTPD